MARLRAGRPRNRISISGRGKIFFCTPLLRLRLCSPTELPSACVKVNLSHYRPEVPRGFQEIKVPRLRDNGPGWW